MYLSRLHLTSHSMWELYLFPIPNLHEADRNSKASLDSDFIPVKRLTNGPSLFSSFSVLDVTGWAQAEIFQKLTKLELIPTF